MKKFASLFHLVIFCTLVALFTHSCNKDADFSTKGFDAQDAPERTVTIDYNFNELKEYEALLVGIAKTIGEEIKNDPEFKQAFWTRLVYHKARATKEYFIVDFLQDRFGEKTGENILKDSPFLTPVPGATEQIRNDYPNLVFKVPQYVEVFFYDAQYLEEDVEVFSYHPFAVFANIEARNENGKWVGYGDLSNSDKGMVQIGFQEMYNGYIPIHIKKSERHVLLVDDDTTHDGFSLQASINSNTSRAYLQCLNQIVQDNVVDPNFNGGRYQRVNYHKLVNEVKKCFGGEVDTDSGSRDLTVTPLDTEICDNGLDDDGDGLIDLADPDCQNCQNVYFRDCAPDYNRITGARFKDFVNFLAVANPLLPQVEELVDLRFDITRLTNIPGCTTNCPYNADFHVTRDRTLLIFNDYTYPYTVDIDDPFEFFYSPTNNPGWSGYFMVDATVSRTPPVPGAIAVGRIGEIKLGGFWRSPLYGYIYGTTWVSTDFSYMNIGGGWDASLYGDLMKVSVTEIDGISASTETTTSNTNTNAHSLTLGLTAKIGAKQGLGANVSYSFTNTNVKATSREFTVTADQVVPLGTFSLRYQDAPTPQHTLIANFMAFGYGWNYLDEYFYGARQNAQIVDVAEVNFIDLIRID